MKKEQLPGNPKFPPEGEGSGSRYESADLDIEKLQDYLRETVFEDEKDIEELLTGRYNIHRRENIGHIESGITRIFNKDYIEEIKKQARGEKPDWSKIRSRPLSGVEPQAVARLTLKTTGGKEFDLRVFKVFNRNRKFRYEYVLKPAEDLQEKP